MFSYRQGFMRLTALVSLILCAAGCWASKEAYRELQEHRWRANNLGRARSSFMQAKSVKELSSQLARLDLTDETKNQLSRLWEIWRMSDEVFGQLVKLEYPAYKDMDDADLGRRVRAKYRQFGQPGKEWGYSKRAIVDELRRRWSTLSPEERRRVSELGQGLEVSAPPPGFVLDDRQTRLPFIEYPGELGRKVSTARWLIHEAHLEPVSASDYWRVVRLGAGGLILPWVVFLSLWWVVAGFRARSAPRP